MANEIGTAIREGAATYAGLRDQATRTTVRARLLHQLDQLGLTKMRDRALPTQRVSADQLRKDQVLRGAAVLHLDMVFRSSVSAEEVLFTADRGIVRFAYHPGLPELPIGVVLAQPTARLVRRRADLFEFDNPLLGQSPLVMPYAVAASPGRLGAGAALINAVIADCAELPELPRVVTLSPLTGMRARVIALVDDTVEWMALCEASPSLDGDLLKHQLLDLLARDVYPGQLEEPARSWLQGEAGRFAASDRYAVGNFHRAMGAHLIGLAEGADPRDSDALWLRCYFDYGVPAV